MKYLSFQDRSRLFAFVSHLSRNRFEALEGLVLIELADDGRDVLALPDERVADMALTTLDHFGATQAQGAALDDGVPLQELHAHVDLEETAARAPSDQLLVLPMARHAGAHRDAIAELVSELSEQAGFKPAMWPARFTTGAREPLLIFRLDAISRAASHQVPELRGRPHILALDSQGTNFIPVGHRHPLAGAYGFLFPPLQAGVFRGWFPVEDGGRTRWRLRHFKPDEAEPLPLLRTIELNALASVGRSQLAAPLESDLRIGLEIGPERSADGVLSQRRVRRLHRFSSSRGILGPRILQLLDHAEARANDLVYYHGMLTGDPESVVQHFVLESRLRQEHDEFVPAGERVYIQPESFERHGLPLFLQRGACFRPDLVQLLDALPDASAFVADLRSRLGLTADADTLAVIEPGQSPIHPRVVILKDGRPLVQAVRFTLDHFHADRINVAAEAAQSHFEERVEASHAKLVDLAQAECADVDHETANFLAALGTLSDGTESALDALEKRVGAAEQLVRDANERFERSQASWKEFVQDVMDLEAHLAETSYEWIKGFRAEERKLQLALLAREFRAVALQAWCQERLDSLIGLREELEERCAAVEALAGELEPQAAACEELSARIVTLRREADERHRRWEQRLDEVQRTLKQNVDESAAKSAQLAARKHHLDDEARDLQRRSEDLDRRLREAEAQERRIEEQRLEVETKADQLHTRLERIRAKGATPVAPSRAGKHSHTMLGRLLSWPARRFSGPPKPAADSKPPRARREARHDEHEADREEVEQPDERRTS